MRKNMNNQKEALEKHDNSVISLKYKKIYVPIQTSIPQ